VDNLIAPSKALGYSDIYLDFVAGLYTARHLYAVDNIAEVATCLDAVPYDRDQAADILKNQNIALGATEATLANIKLLRDPRTVCVFSGQQAGLLTGPLLVIIKALAIVKAAAEYSRELDRPVVPIFWIAGDDHDFEEVNHTVLLDRQAEIRTIAYEPPPKMGLPTAEIFFDDEAALATVKQQVRDSLGESDFTDDLYRLIDDCYTVKDTYVSAFGKFMTALTGQFGLIFFSPGDAAAKTLAAPLFKAILDRQDELHDLISEANSHITGHGYHIQVEKADNATHLFCNLDGRKPVLRVDDDRFSIGDRVVSRAELHQMIGAEPGRFSPDVMTRPILQSYLFPVVSQKGGPSEIAYLAQVNPLFSLFSRVAPYHAARPTATLVEARFEKMMAEHAISFEDLTGDIEQVINRVLAETFPADLDLRFSELKETVQQQFEEFVERSLQFDRQLASFGKQISGKIDFNLKAFEGKVFSAHKRKSAETRERIYRLYNSLYTNRGLQERALNITYFLARHGMAFMTLLFDRLESEESAHQLISLKENDG